MPDQAQMIICPKCKNRFPLTQAVFDQIEEQVRLRIEKVNEKKAAQLSEKEAILNEKSMQLKKAQEKLEEEVSTRLETERPKLEKDLKKRVTKEFELKLKAAEEEINEKEQKLDESRKKEVELIKKQRKLEEEKKAFELESLRKMEEDRKMLTQEIKDQVQQEYQLKLAEQEKVIKNLARDLQDAKQKAEQGSQQLQGEILEEELERILKSTFPSDQIEPVSAGVRGADVLQQVFNRAGQHCGTIIWESKRAKAWSDRWLDKLQDDQRQAKAEIAVLLTTTPPKDSPPHFFQKNGVWITDYTTAMGLATALRMHLLQLAESKVSQMGKESKMEQVYNYLCGSEFRQRIQALVQPFIAMQEDLEREKRVSEKNWAKREKQLQQVVNSTAAMYGDLQGIIGASLPEIDSLEPEVLPDNPEYAITVKSLPSKASQKNAECEDVPF